MPQNLLRYSSFEMRHLRLLVAVAEERSLTGAAARLRLTTSALSHQLRQLEEIAGAAMFHRDRRGMSPTSAGETLLSAARTALAAMQEGEERLGGNGRRQSTIIRLCTHCYTGYAWLPPILTRLSRESDGNLDVRIFPEATRQPLEALHDRKIDLALMLYRPVDPGLTVQRLFQDDMLLLIPPTHRLADRSWVALSEFEQEHLILHPETIEETHFFRDHLAPSRIRPKRFTGVMLTEAIIAMVKAGLGVTVLPRWSAANFLLDGSVLAKRITRRGLVRVWYAATRNKPENGAVLANLTRQIAADMAGGGRPSGRVDPPKTRPVKAKRAGPARRPPLNRVSKRRRQ